METKSKKKKPTKKKESGTTKKKESGTKKKEPKKVKKEKKVKKSRGVTVIREETEPVESDEKYRSKLNSIINKIRNQSLTVSENTIRFGWKY